MNKPMLASDWDPGSVKFPVIGQPKIDGVRALNIDGNLYARSLKQFKNKHVTEFFSDSKLNLFDGELAVLDETAKELCRATTSAVGTILGDPDINWHVFDLMIEGVTYEQRLRTLKSRIDILKKHFPQLGEHVHIVKSHYLLNMNELLDFHDYNLDKGYEGTILRDPDGVYKHGRSTVKEGGLLRVKTFNDSEAIVIDVVEGQSNQNDAQVNELGLQFRSSHKDNMVPNGKVGALICEALQDIEIDGMTFIMEGQQLTISPGNMNHAEREYYFKNKGEIIGKTIKFKYFPKGVKEQLRFPTFVCFRDVNDL